MSTLVSNSKSFNPLDPSISYSKIKKQDPFDYLRSWEDFSFKRSAKNYFSKEVFGKQQPKPIELVTISGGSRKYEPLVSSILPLVLNIGEKFIVLPESLREIENEILNSKHILELKEDWDYNGAEPITKEIYDSSILFLIEYSKFILNNTGNIIQAPEINPGRNGNIYLAWRTDNARLAISIEKSDSGDILAHYYGDLKNNGQPINGNVSTKSFSDYLAYWMKNLI